MSFDTKDILALLSACVSVIAAGIAWRSITRNLRPVLVFICDGSAQMIWYIRNVGTGPALDILVAQKDLDDGKWCNFLRFPPLAKDGEIRLPFVPHSSAVTYADAEGKSYSTSYSGFKNRPQKGRIFKKPADQALIE